jgi:hypothetical protein
MGGCIKFDLIEIGYNAADWIKLAQDGIQRRFFVNTVMNCQVV